MAGKHIRELFDLTGKTAIVTGGGRGLGEQMAHALVEAGLSNIVLCSRRVENCESVAAALREKGANADALACNVADANDVENVVRYTLDKYGQIHILINNSGIAWGADVLEMPEEKWDLVFDVNVKGTFLMSRAVGRSMIEHRYGKIINIASVAGLRGEPPQILNAIGYSASKGAVIAFTRDLAKKWAPYNITVNAIAPGFFPTRMTRGVLDKAGELIKMLSPMRRIGNEDDLKGVTVLLASDASSFITGTVIPVDGGASA
ncbi:MAG: gluconate 5-dehydrogenase [Bacillaceae bacterium G1]|nr:gluconate 5-dehydrogenase [Bacillota bacterium]OJF16676.1 MAG: gluconate 5-dehydrogenase [Bacillaceae bacterium G1]